MPEERHPPAGTPIVEEAGAAAPAVPAAPSPDAQLRAVKDTSTVWLWEQDAEFRFTMDLRGRDHGPGDSSVLGMRRWESKAVPLHGTWDDHRRCLEAHEPFRDFEFRVGQGPQARYISTTGVPVYHPDGSFAGYRGTALDITDLKNSQEEAGRAQSLLKLASRLGRVAAWSIELPGLRMGWSQDFLRMLDFDPGATPGARDLLARVQPSQHAALGRAWRACVNSGVPFDLELRMNPAGSKPMWMRLIGEAVRGPDGGIQWIQGAAQDITASKEDRERLRSLGEQLAASNAELSKRVRERTRELELVNSELKGFAHALAHDLKSPIAAVEGFGRALDEALSMGDLAHGRHYAGRIRAAGLRMGEYVDALLSMAETSQSIVDRSQVDLSAMAAGVLDELQARDPGRRVHRSIQPGLVVQGDRRLLRMLLENLLGNAWKFTARREGAEIALTGTVDEAGETVYSVRDNGAGFDMEWAGRLFGTFQRLHSVDEYAGTGIGLANAQRVVTRHGGRIWAKGRVGEGATFSFTLPAPAAREPGAQEPGS
jgi:signal transduction histidine kinase